MHPLYRRWGSAVVVFNPALSFEPIETWPLNSERWRPSGQPAISHPGAWSAIKLVLADDSVVTLVSAYGPFEDYNPEIESGYYTTSVHRMLSDLTPLIDSAAGKRMVIAGPAALRRESCSSSDRTKPPRHFGQRWRPPPGNRGIVVAW